MIGISENNEFNIEERLNIVNQLLKLSKMNLLNNKEKTCIINIINSFKNKTVLQIERFSLYYNLTIIEGNFSLNDLAKKYNCSTGAVRSSINTICSKLCCLKDERIYKIQEIVLQCKNRNKIK